MYAMCSSRDTHKQVYIIHQKINKCGHGLFGCEFASSRGGFEIPFVDLRLNDGLASTVTISE